MSNAILIYSGQTRPVQGSESTGSTVFTVRYIRFNDEVDRNWMMLGMSLKDMLDGSVIEHGIIPSPDGAPTKPHSLGHGVPSTLEGAVHIARTALANEDSEIRQKGFDPDTPIYHWHDGEPAELLSASSD